MFDRRNNLSAAGRRRRPRLPRRGGVRYGHPAQRAPLRGAEPRHAGADLRPRCPGSEAYMRLAARDDRRACRKHRRRRHERRPIADEAVGLGRGLLDALLGERAGRRSTTAAAPARRRAQIDRSSIEPHPDQPRQHVRRGGAGRAGRSRSAHGRDPADHRAARTATASRSSPASGAGARRRRRGCTESRRWSANSTMPRRSKWR